MSPYVQETDLARDRNLEASLAYSMSENIEGEEKTQDRTVSKRFLQLDTLIWFTNYEVNQDGEDEQHGDILFGVSIKSFFRLEFIYFF